NDSHHHITELNNEYEMQTLIMNNQVRHNNIHIMVPLTNNHMLTSQPAFRTHTPQDQPSNLIRNYVSQQPPSNRNDQIFQTTVSHVPYQSTELNDNQDSNHFVSPVQANIQINNNLQPSNLSDQSL
ncbi:7131_t:CDS:1, partial [Cetraspora pellucida]